MEDWPQIQWGQAIWWDWQKSSIDSRANFILEVRVKILIYTIEGQELSTQIKWGQELRHGDYLFVMPFQIAQPNLQFEDLPKLNSKKYANKGGLKTYYPPTLQVYF